MKKFLLSVVAMLALLAPQSANAGTIVGNEDNSSDWWTAFSEFYTLQDGDNVTIKFTNYSSQGENWYNWLIVMTNGAYPTDADYAASSEYFALRCDNYGWGNNYADGTLDSNYNWDTFKADMDGSSVVLVVSRDGNAVSIRADITTTENVAYYETFNITIADLPSTAGFFLTTQLGHLDIESAVTTGISSIEAESAAANAPAYNLAGQRVSDGSKGLVIKNGKKYVVK